MSLSFGRDPIEATQNLRKHGVSFAEAVSVFSDARARLIDDPDHSSDEERFILLGLSVNLQVLVVVHCYRKPGGMIRLISARKATRGERQFYP